MMNEWKKIGLPILLTFIASFVLNYIIFYRDMDFSEQQNIIRSIDDLKSKKADRDEFDTYKIESKAYVDKEIGEVKSEIKGDIEDIKEMIRSDAKKNEEFRDMMRDYVKAMTQ